MGPAPNETQLVIPKVDMSLFRDLAWGLRLLNLAARDNWSDPRGERNGHVGITPWILPVSRFAAGTLRPSPNPVT